MKQETKEFLDWYSESGVAEKFPLIKIKKKCLCCGKEMEVFLYEVSDFCDRCFPIVCQEVFNKANDDMTVEEVRERIRRNVEND